MIDPSASSRSITFDDDSSSSLLNFNECVGVVAGGALSGYLTEARGCSQKNLKKN